MGRLASPFDPTGLDVFVDVREDIPNRLEPRSTGSVQLSLRGMNLSVIKSASQ
jgi:hypothetical protein